MPLMLFRRLPVLAVSAALVRSVVSLEPRSLYSLSARSLDGHELQHLYSKLAPEGFVVLAFPCNQFGGQEPGSPSEIRAFADSKGVTFPIFEKVEVNGPRTHPVYKYLKGGSDSMFDSVKWNFAKFLVGRDGKVISRYLPTTSPSSIEGDIQAALMADAPKDEL
ncbi:glutathione peroxidase [Chrysochromulina tobinii]|uniref:Glutathione peroxidase n=1 Tax=Chrysochromulina tobinii TaxID=1460289 RepID=A0A0M0J916_9EUKA|nr:glutathione peroxidase [Chrysochromulina tobinii]|eukprot:KOO22852.1 glutathione peroxidase [Chrysochromulina sp. CCMP291]